MGKAIELNPGVVDAMQDRGHEVASHSYRWIDYAGLEEAEERRHIETCLDVITKASSKGTSSARLYKGRSGTKRVVHGSTFSQFASSGVVSSLQARLNTRETYKSRGLDHLLYDCDAYNDDLPYWVDMPEENGLLVIPYTLDVNDMKFAVPPGFTDPDSFFKYARNAFDVLRAEGGKMMSIGLHCRLIGMPFLLSPPAYL